MASSSIEKFAREVDSYIDSQIDTYQEAKSEQEHFSSTMNSYSGLFAAAGISSSEFQREARSGLSDTRKECIQNIEDKFKLVDSEFESLKKNLKQPDDFMYLYERLNKWIDKISGPFGELYSIKSMKQKLDRFATKSPVLKTAELEKKKSAYLTQIKEKKGEIAKLERTKESAENEYKGYVTNYNEHIQNIEKEIENERIGVEREIENKELQLSDLENKKMSLNRELTGLGFFAGSKKKSIKLQIENANGEIDSIKNSVQELEKKRNDIASSKPDRISKLDDSIQRIKDRIERIQKQIDELNLNIGKKESAVEEIDDEIKNIK